MKAWILDAFRRVPIGWRLLSRERTRLLVTVAGVGFAIVLMLFLAGIYRGVDAESNGYVSQRPAHAWVAQDTASNMVRSSSYLTAPSTEELEDVEGVASVSPLLEFITSLSIGGRPFTAFVCGVDPTSATTRPTIVAGSGTLNRGQIIVDRALARRAGLAIGDALTIKGKRFVVSGISTGTNAIITQFTFVSLRDAEELVGFRGIVSFYLVSGVPGVDPKALATRLKATAPTVNVFTGAEFSRNNLQEMRTGLLPLLASVALFGIVVGAALLTLLLYGAVLERREDYAVLKALGAGRGFLRAVVFRQAMAAVLGGLVFGGAAYAVIVPILQRLAPTVALAIGWHDVALIATAALLMGVLGAWIPLRKVERIYPAEVFRA